MQLWAAVQPLPAALELSPTGSPTVGTHWQDPQRVRGLQCKNRRDQDLAVGAQCLIDQALAFNPVADVLALLA